MMLGMLKDCGRGAKEERGGDQREGDEHGKRLRGGIGEMVFREKRLGFVG